MARHATRTNDGTILEVWIDNGHHADLCAVCTHRLLGSRMTDGACTFQMGPARMTYKINGEVVPRLVARAFWFSQPEAWQAERARSRMIEMLDYAGEGEGKSEGKEEGRG